MSDHIIQCFYRISTKALILDDQGRFLLCKEENNMWELPGGGLDHGESPRECLTRELMEEMGIQLTDMNPAPSYFVTTLNTEKTRWIANIIHETMVEHLNFTPSEECVEIGFFTKEEASRLPLFPNVEKFIEIFDPKKGPTL